MRLIKGFAPETPLKPFLKEGFENPKNFYRFLDRHAVKVRE
jgi:hypothetical protein